MENRDKTPDPSRRLKYCRAVEAAIWGMPLVTFDAMRQAFFHDARAKYGDIVFFSAPADWRAQFTTPNNSSLYVYLNFNTSDGALVLEIPAAEGVGLFGSINDAWQAPLADIGPEGADRGKGGKYIILPPGEQHQAPEGYIPVRSDTFNGYSLLRAIPKSHEAADIDAAIALIKKLRIYPLSKVANPPQVDFIDMTGKLFDAVASFDESFYESLARMFHEEPVLPRDLMATPLLRAIGIEKGKEFKPDASTRALLEAALKEVHHLMTNFAYEGEPYWPNTHWTTSDNPFRAKTVFSFVDSEYYDLDARAGTFFIACAPPKKLGRATYYLNGARDSRGEPLSGENSYRLRVPPNVPAKQFWSVTVYDLETASFIRDTPRQSIDSFDKKARKNADGSMDVLFGPSAPAGMEANWIQTQPGKRWFMFFRFYGPEKAVFDKSWKLPDAEPLSGTQSLKSAG